jgi:hypothetical protein
MTTASEAYDHGTPLRSSGGEALLVAVDGGRLHRNWLGVLLREHC